MQRKLLIILSLLLLIAIFAFQNAQPITLTLFFWKFDAIPLAIIVIASIFAGSLIMSLFSLISLRSYKQQVKALKAELLNAEEEIVALKKQEEEPEEEIHPEGEKIIPSDNIRFFDE
ncbi:LapA family protein [Prolixibacteraceae bacterium JC049]|nr:LapA family protein [Prolixibacteraceae bacterium JC049]